VTLEHPHAELSAYIDGALSPSARAAVDGHLATCALCRAHVAQLRATSALLRALPDPVPAHGLVPRLAAPAWLAPLRTLMTVASGAAAFLFVASALVSSVTSLATNAPAGAPAPELSRDAVASDQAPKPEPPAATAKGGAPASPNAAFSVSGPTPSSAPSAVRRDVGAASPDDRTRENQTGASGGPAAGAALDERARAATSAPRPSPVLNPWLWLALAIVCGAIAIALQRRLRASR
jgi:anti-sigma factor RsiW